MEDCDGKSERIAGEPDESIVKQPARRGILGDLP